MAGNDTGVVEASVSRRIRLITASTISMAAIALFVAPRRGTILPDTGTIFFGLLPAGPTAHILILAAAACVWAWAFPRASILRLLFGGVVFSAVSESLQLLPFVHRGAALTDFGYNVLGVLLGLAAMILVRREGRRKRRLMVSEA